MTNYELAKLIPTRHRTLILHDNVIYKAIPKGNDIQMKILFTLWTNYVDPGGDHDIECGFCLNEMLNNFKTLLPHLVDLAKEEKLLEE